MKKARNSLGVRIGGVGFAKDGNWSNMGDRGLALDQWGLMVMTVMA